MCLKEKLTNYECLEGKYCYDLTGKGIKNRKAHPLQRIQFLGTWGKEKT